MRRNNSLKPLLNTQYRQLVPMEYASWRQDAPRCPQTQKRAHSLLIHIFLVFHQ